MTEDNEYCEKHCKGYRDTGGRCFADGRCDAYWEYQKQKEIMEQEQQTMKIYIAIKLWTPNELGGIGDLSKCEVFKTAEEAIDYVRRESGEEPNTRNHNYVCEATQVTDWDGDLIQFYVIEKEI